jgi:hypothetical protein
VCILEVISEITAVNLVSEVGFNFARIPDIVYSD